MPSRPAVSLLVNPLQEQKKYTSKSFIRSISGGQDWDGDPEWESCDAQELVPVPNPHPLLPSSQRWGLVMWTLVLSLPFILHTLSLCLEFPLTPLCTG